MLKLLDGRRVEINGTHTTTVTSIEITLLQGEVRTSWTILTFTVYLTIC